MENQYSTIFIVDISQNPDEVDTISSRIQQLIEDHGGVIKKIDRWGKRRLAYTINKNTHGFYVEIEFTANSRLNIPRILEAEYRINDRVLRFLTYNITKKELIQRSKNAGKAKARELEQQEMKTETETTVKEEVQIPEAEETKKADVPAEEEKIEETVSSETQDSDEKIEETVSSETQDSDEKIEETASSDKENSNEKIEEQ